MPVPTGFSKGSAAPYLREGRLAGAASDVFGVEPLPQTSELWSAPSFVVTPHVAGASQLSWRKMIDLFFANLERFMAGKALQNLVDKRTGY